MKHLFTIDTQRRPLIRRMFPVRLNCRTKCYKPCADPKKGFAERVDYYLLQLSSEMGRRLDRAEILEMMLEAFEAAQQGKDGAEALAVFARRDQPPQDRAAGR